MRRAQSALPPAGLLSSTLRARRWVWGVGSLQSRGGAGPGADTASAAAQQLVTAALKKGTKDNVTAIVGLFQWQ